MVWDVLGDCLITEWCRSRKGFELLSMLIIIVYRCDVRCHENYLQSAEDVYIYFVDEGNPLQHI